jgi:asparagine synthase (glutamine-hydrolysing)
MCGIAGLINFESNLSDKRDIINKMAETLSKRGPDDSRCYYSKNVLLGHSRLIVVDPSGGAQPMIKHQGDNNYVIVYNGELYNTEDLRKLLIEAGYSFNAYSDTEVLLVSYMHWGIDCLKYINGIFAFAIWDEGKQQLFLARDPLGVKPLFYSRKGSSLTFGSEIKALLANPEIEPILTRDGLTKLLALGPARIPGDGILKDIYEIEPANYMIFSKDKFTLSQYWRPECKDYHEDIDTCTDHVRDLLTDAIKRQLVGDVPICSFLSGGLDSSLISAVASTEFKSHGKILDTYAIDYKDNELYFKSDEFQPTSDSYWAGVMADYIGSNHHTVLENSTELAKALFDSVIANDMPGMADVDSSLYVFCKQVRKEQTVALSGECAMLLINYARELINANFQLKFQTSVMVYNYFI